MTPSIEQRAREAAEKFRTTPVIGYHWLPKDKAGETLVEIITDLLTAQHAKDVAAQYGFVPDKDIPMLGPEMPSCEIVEGGIKVLWRTLVLHIQKHSNENAALVASGDKDRARLDWVEITSSTSGKHITEWKDVLILAPGNHGGSDSDWLIAVEDESTRTSIIEATGASLREALDAAMSATQPTQP